MKRRHLNPYLTAGLVITVLMIAVTVIGIFWTPYAPTAMKYGRFQPPSWQHLFGTDNFGRDIFSRVLKGTGTTLAIALAAVAISGCQVPAPKGQRTAALDDAAWSASKWISVAECPVVTGGINDEANGRAADGASWFLSSLKNEARIVQARWMTAGLGIYDLYVNGQRVGEEVLKPGFTHREKTKRSFTYDITELMRTSQDAENQLAVQVTPGWWADKIVTPWGHDGMIGHKCAFRGVVELTFVDGTHKLYGTDLQNWRAGIAGPVTHAGIFDGEEYDARIRPGYETPELLSTPEENTEFQGDILPSEGAEVYLREDLALAPVRAYVWKDIEGATDDVYGKVSILREYTDGQEMTLAPGETLVVDFGQNAAAVPSFVFKAAEGTVLTCLPAELLNDSCGARSRGMDGPEGSVHRDNLRFDKYGFRAVYTFAGSEDYESYHPRCTFFGYRYVSITATADVAIRQLRSLPVTSIAKNLETGVISYPTRSGDSARTISACPQTAHSATNDWDGRQTLRCSQRPVPSSQTHATSSINGCAICATPRTAREDSREWHPPRNTEESACDSDGQMQASSSHGPSGNNLLIQRSSTRTGRPWTSSYSTSARLSTTTRRSPQRMVTTNGLTGSATNPWRAVEEVLSTNADPSLRPWTTGTTSA